MDRVPFFVAGVPVSGPDEVIVRHPYDQRPVARTSYATAAQVARAVAAAAELARQEAWPPPQVRAEALGEVARRLSARAEEAARLITGESGKPLRWARAEVRRTIATFEWAAREARRIDGELHWLGPEPLTSAWPPVPADGSSAYQTDGLTADGGSTAGIALVGRRPAGPVLAITPVSSPLYSVAQQVAPALAVGAPVVVKPASATPLSALLIGELLSGTRLPTGMHSVLPLPEERTGELVAEPDLPVVSFAGSVADGAVLRQTVPQKRVILAPVTGAEAMICEDWAADDDFTRAARRIATGAEHPAGQGCLAVQRVFVHEWLYDGFLPRLVEAVGKLRTGDPFDEATEVGPLLDLASTRQVERWVDAAVRDGMTVEVGGRSDGTCYLPTVLSSSTPTARPASQIPGPVLVIAPVESDTAGFAAVSDTGHGCRAAIFTHNLEIAFAAYRMLRTDRITIGDVPLAPADEPPEVAGVELPDPLDRYRDRRVMVLAGQRL